jgi:hypothetical protein
MLKTVETSPRTAAVVRLPVEPASVAGLMPWENQVTRRIVRPIAQTMIDKLSNILKFIINFLYPQSVSHGWKDILDSTICCHPAGQNLPLPI